MPTDRIVVLFSKVGFPSSDCRCRSKKLNMITDNGNEEKMAF